MCADVCVKLLSVLTTQGIPVSLAWSEDSTALFVGSTDGNIRRFLIDKTRADLRIKLDKEKTRPIVWSLVVLKVFKFLMLLRTSFLFFHSSWI